MNTKNKNLFPEFEGSSKKQWKEKVNIDIKGADFNKRLVWKNINNIDIQPFYNHEDPITIIDNTGKNSSLLVNYRSIPVRSEKKGNELAIQAVKEGINGLIFNIKEYVLIDQLLKNIDLNTISVGFILQTKELELATDFFSFVAESKINPTKLKGFFDLNLLEEFINSGELDPHRYEIISKLIGLSSQFPNFKAVSISGIVFADSGANQVQEIAFTLNSMVEAIEIFVGHKIDIKDVFNNLHFQLSIGSEYFVEIGKFRAFNHLLHEIASKYDIAEFDHILMAKTSIWNKSVTDAHTNMLRATTETMSAILGNVDAVLIDPFDSQFNKPTDFSSRIAGNIATILREESYFGKVSNPVDGSYYIEKITSDLAGAALDKFKAIESSGGFNLAFSKKLIQNQIREIRNKKLSQISHRKLALVGVNKYPNLMETISLNQLNGKYDQLENDTLKPRRASLEIESLRKVTENIVNHTNKRPIVELTSFGNLTMRKARAAFAYDFMGVSGFNILPEKSFDTIQEAAQSSARSTSDVVVICSSDQDYDEKAIEFTKEFRTISERKILLLAGNPTNLMEELKIAGLDGCIHIKSNIIDTISTVQKKIQENLKPIES